MLPPAASSSDGATSSLWASGHRQQEKADVCRRGGQVKAGAGGLRCQMPCPGQLGTGRLGDPQSAARGGVSPTTWEQLVPVSVLLVLPASFSETSVSLTLSKLKPVITPRKVLC